MSYTGFVVMDAVLLFISGIYPTVIVILVGMQKSPVEHYSIYSTRMQFSNGSAFKPPTDGSTTRPVFTIHHEYTSDSDTQIPSSVFVKTSDEEKSFGR